MAVQIWSAAGIKTRSVRYPELSGIRHVKSQ